MNSTKSKLDEIEKGTTNLEHDTYLPTLGHKLSIDLPKTRYLFMYYRSSVDS